jgi:hypothetical protein
MKRRQFLQSVGLGAGSVLLSPVLRQVEAHAAGDAPPLRFVFVLESNGRLPKFMQPSGIEWPEGQYHTRVEKLIDQPLTSDNALPKGLAPLEPYRERMTVIQGLSGKIADGGGHSANFGALGCCPGKAPDGTYKPLTETIDAALGRALPAVFPQLVLGIVKDANLSMVYNCSATGKNKPIPTICHPDLAYSTVFGSVAEGSARQQFNSDRNLLDFMVDDIRRVDSQLTGGEREKFQRHLEAFEALRDQQSRLNDLENTLREHAPVYSSKYKSNIETDRLDAHFDLGAAALVGGLTNVLTIASGVGQDHMSVTFRGLGVDVAKHELGHGTKDKGRDADDVLDIIRAHHAALIVRLMKKLQAVPEGDGTMMDNTLIFFTSDAGNTHHPGFDQWPLLVIGDLGGRLKTRGRFLGYPKYGAEGHRTMANLYLTFLEAVGAPRKSFGVPDSNLRDIDQTGPLAELMV